MKILTIEYSGRSFADWANLGDDIQSLVAGQLLPRVDGGISREALSRATEPAVVSMNGYFLGMCDWPPAEILEPFFFAFHVTPGSAAKVCSPEGLAYLRKFQPIGCRDQGTTALLKRHGIEAYYSKCITLTLPRRQAPPVDGKVFLVGLSKGAERAVPKRLRKHAVVVDQAKLRLPDLSPDLKATLARHLLDTYARRATLVITSKIHCAMPCIAMGIPVVFLYDRKKRADYRVQIVDELIGIHFVGESWFARTFANPWRGRSINWNPAPLEFEAEKQRIRDGYLQAFQRAVDRFAARRAAGTTAGQGGS